MRVPGIRTTATTAFAALSLVVFAERAAGQAGTQAPPSGTQATPPATPPAESLSVVVKPPEAGTAPTASLTGRILSSDRRPVSAVTITAKAVDENLPAITKTDTTDANGRYEFVDLPTGRYELVVDYAESRSLSEQRAVDGADTADVRLPIDSEGSRGTRREIMLTITCLFLYWLVIVLARWNNIARSLTALIDRQLASLKARLDTEVDLAATKRIDVLKETLTDLRTKPATTGRMDSFYQKWTRLWEIIFWSRGEENARWVAIHEIERQLMAYIAPPEQVDAYLRWARAELRRLDLPVATAVGEAIDIELAMALDTDPAKRARDEGARKALLGRAVAIIYAERDAGFSTLMEWQNKAGWLILVALVMIAFLTVAAGHAVLFLAGATGGYLSRLGRALRSQQMPLDYGASWTTLFLSPVFGAIAGWFGIALITLAARPEINLLGSAFELIRWNDPYSPWTLAVAFLLGFSERLFDAVVGALEKNAERNGPAQGGTLAPTAAADAATVANVTTRAMERAARTLQPAGRNGTSPDTGLAIVRVERLLRAAGNDADVLRIIGSGFDSNATALVNGEPRRIEVRSPTIVLMSLTEADIDTMDMGGDFEIVIVNPNGNVSTAFDALSGADHAAHTK